MDIIILLIITIIIIYLYENINITIDSNSYNHHDQKSKCDDFCKTQNLVYSNQYIKNKCICSKIIQNIEQIPSNTDNIPFVAKIEHFDNSSPNILGNNIPIDSDNRNIYQNIQKNRFSNLIFG